MICFQIDSGIVRYMHKQQEPYMYGVFLCVSLLVQFNIDI